MTPQVFSITCASFQMSCIAQNEAPTTYESLSSRLSIGGNGGKQSLRDNSTTEGTKLEEI